MTVRVLQWLAAALALFTGVVCLPGLLLTVQSAVWSNLDRTEVMQQPLSSATVVLAAVGAGWLLWGWLLTATILDVVAVLRGVGAVRARLPVPLHHAVSAVAGSAAMLLQPSAALAAGAGPLVGDTAGHVSVQATYPAALPPAAAVIVDGGDLVLVGSGAAGGPALQPRSYTVRRGDTLARIAARQIGDANRWPEIFTLNRGVYFDRVGGTFTNPDLIYPGWTLRLPGVEPAVPVPTESAPPQGTSSASSGKQTNPAIAASASPVATPTASTVSGPAAATTSNPDSNEDSDGADVLPWLLLAGGAAAVGAAAFRRQRSQPRRTSTPAGASRAARTPARNAGPSEHRPTRERDAPAAGRSDAAAGAATDLPPAPVDDTRRVVAALSPASGTTDRVVAARARIGALLEDRHGSTAVVICADTLAALAPDVSPRAGLTVTGTLAEAIRLLETEVLHRTRLLVEHDVADIDDIADLADLDGSVEVAADGAAAGLPAVTFIVQPSDEHLRARITALLGQGEHLGIDGIVLDMPSGIAAPDADPGSGHRAITHDQPPPPTTRPATRPGPHRTKVRIRVFGTVAVLHADDRTVTGMRSHARELLTYLTVHRTGAALPDIMEAIWPDATVSRAEERLSTVVWNLRHSIRTAAGDHSVQPVINTGSRYHLNPDLLDIDAWRLDDALSTARHNPTRQQTALQTALRAAVAAHTGDLAGDLPYAWIEADRHACRQQGITARRQLAELVRTNDPGEAADLLDQAADLQPADDALARDAITALAHAGDTERVTARWERLRSALADIGEQPEAASVALYTQIQGRSSTPAGRQRHA
ncbi:BTAD domain-containing putative transcriptional regulator [Dactylosporangium sp. NPDC049525]|uniref:BTAD domain-containing putative transcriptional regulator n=1 Tax=Dactylosporangium sp. NPDC049525 TaxID=3154730 RepID=UPI003430D458